MERILAGFVVALVFCIVTGVAYLRMPPAPADEAAHSHAAYAESTTFSGQRHSPIPVEGNPEPAEAIASTR
jgi:hypothetical protein